MSRRLLRTAGAGALLGVSLYVGSDVVGEYTTYIILRDHGLTFAQQDDQLAAQIGKPFEVGPWYNASIGFTQSGHIAAVTFPLKGSTQITDVTVRAVRKPGLSAPAIYNFLGGEWKVLDCSAMAPAPGGQVRPRSIMPQLPVPKVENGKVVLGQECDECNRKAATGAGTAAPQVTAQPAPPPPPPQAHGSDAEDGETQPAAAQKKRRRFWIF